MVKDYVAEFSYVESSLSEWSMQMIAPCFDFGSHAETNTCRLLV